jgi:hypothetical protein
MQRLWFVSVLIGIGIACLVLAPSATACISWGDGRSCETGWTIALNVAGWVLLALAALLSGAAWLRRPPRPELDSAEVTRRTDALLTAVRERLNEDEAAWADDHAGYGEWELALAVIHDAARDGRLVLTDPEAAELFAIGEHVDRRMLEDLVRPPGSLDGAGASAEFDPVTGAPIGKDAGAARRP